MKSINLTFESAVKWPFCRPVERSFVCSLAPFSHALVDTAVTVTSVKEILHKRKIIKNCLFFDFLIKIFSFFINWILQPKMLFICSIFENWAINVNKKSSLRWFQFLRNSTIFVNFFCIAISGVSGCLGAESCCTKIGVLHQLRARVSVV